MCVDICTLYVITSSGLLTKTQVQGNKNREEVSTTLKFIIINELLTQVRVRVVKVKVTLIML